MTAQPGAARPDVRSVRATYRRLRKLHPDAHCELDHSSPFELVVATVLSAQTTDKLVNQVTPELFRRWPNPAALADADASDVESVLSRMGMFRRKTQSILRLARMLCDDFKGEVPRTLEQLIKLPGVGRKTANVVLGVAFSSPEGVVVDTHVARLAQRLGWSNNSAPELVEHDLMSLFQKKDWDMLAHTLIFHGRRVCSARAPACAACDIAKECPSAFDAESVGRKAPRPPRRSKKATAKTTKQPAKKKAAKKKTATKKTTRTAATKKHPAKNAAPRKTAAKKRG